MKPKRADYIHIGRWVNPVLILSLWFKGKPNRVFQKLGINITRNKVYLDGNNFTFKQDIQRIKKAMQSESFVRDFIKYTAQEVDILSSLIPKLNNFEKYNCTKLFKDFCNQYNQVTGPWNFIVPASEEVELKLKRRKDYDKISRLITPSRKTPLTELRDAIATLRKEIKKKKLAMDIKVIQRKNPGLYNRIEEHIKNYKWYGTFHFTGKPYDEREFIKNIMQENIKISQKVIVSSKWIKTLRNLTWIRQYVAENEARVCYAAQSLIRALAQELKITCKDVLYMTPNEILVHVQNKKKVNIAVIERRKKAFGIYKTKNKDVIIIGQELKKMLNKWVSHEFKRIIEIKGMIASKGQAKGKVQILSNPEFIKNFQKGRILVAPETTPVYFPAMAEAIAIITDMGGITSHAAITSRELGIPCIIGTKIATKALKDGDLVEVDAGAGSS